MREAFIKKSQDPLREDERSGTFLSPGVVNTVSTSSPQGSQGSGRGASHGMAGPLRLAALRGACDQQGPRGSGGFRLEGSMGADRGRLVGEAPCIARRRLRLAASAAATVIWCHGEKTIHLDH